ncbi:glycosyltransferase [Kaistella pullorum]|uniref:Glycosyltransferase n=1 Tax=Kaistella pullorum TaxID=2763074 RepID=A0ABR8WJ47_9FLAO|nr:glycosyltransferase [Kaistella pullorum]MBD8016998.1 glycosyltransferase [Kaistella pullorum]
MLEKGGVLENKIPSFVDVQYLHNFSDIKPIIENPPLYTIGAFLKNFQIGNAIRFVLLYLKIKVTGDWHHNYDAVLKNDPHYGSYDIAVAFAGPSDFITYFIHEKVNAIKKIQWIHFDIEKVVTNFNFGKKYYPAFNQICCVSQSAKDIFLKHFPELKNKTIVFHNIIPVKELKQQAAAGETFDDWFDGVRILTVARFTKEKGQHLIPEAVSKLKADNLHFRWYLIGDGLQRNIVQKEADVLGVSDHLFFLGENENPYRYMQDCNIYVQTSLHEGFGLTVAEAQVFNKPIVVTDFASAKDLVNQNETGIITEISSDGLYQAVKKLLLNLSLQKKFAESTLHRSYNLHQDLVKLLS